MRYSFFRRFLAHQSLAEERRRLEVWNGARRLRCHHDGFWFRAWRIRIYIEHFFGVLGIDWDSFHNIDIIPNGTKVDHKTMIRWNLAALVDEGTLHSCKYLGGYWKFGIGGCFFIHIFIYCTLLIFRGFTKAI